MKELNIREIVRVHPYMSNEKIEEEAKYRVGKAFADFVFENGLYSKETGIDLKRIGKIQPFEPYSLKYKLKVVIAEEND